MNSRLGTEMRSLCVADLANSPTIASDLRLDSAHLRHRSASSRIMQWLLRANNRCFECEHAQKPGAIGRPAHRHRDIARPFSRFHRRSHPDKPSRNIRTAHHGMAIGYKMPIRLMQTVLSSSLSPRPALAGELLDCLPGRAQIIKPIPPSLNVSGCVRSLEGKPEKSPCGGWITRSRPGASREKRRLHFGNARRQTQIHRSTETTRVGH